MRSMKEKRIGQQTPTQSFFLPYDNTRGPGAIKLYEKSGRTAMQWQHNIMNPMMAINEEGLYIHTKFGYSIPRRNGKNEILVMREMEALENGKKTLHTAHRASTSHAAWERLCEALSNAKIEYTSYKQFGFESIFVGEHGRVNFRTRSSKGGLGEGYDLLIIDEAQEYTDDQQSALKYVVTDSDNPQTIMCGTPPTAVSTGTVFEKYRYDVLFDDTTNSGWAEWSIEEQSDPWDKELWYQTNPSLGQTLRERAIVDEVAGDVIDFNIQRLGLWIKSNQKSAISEPEWLEMKVDELPKHKGKLYVGIKYGKDGANVALSLAYKTADGNIFVNCVDCQSIRNGNGWILRFLDGLNADKIVIDGASGQTILMDSMKDARIKIKPILPTVKEVIHASSIFENAIYEKTIRHMAQPSVVQIIGNCEKRSIGSGGGFGYRSLKDEIEVAILDSIVLAHWACSTSKERRKQRVSY